jgi:phosphoribosylamine--glycine ligase
MEKLNILIVGGGGREHALTWKIAQSLHAGNLYIAPGNAGTELLGQNVPINAEDIDAVLKFALEKHIDLTVVGPEPPLAAGIVDLFQQAGLKIFGPTQAAAVLEASKAFSKAFMQEHGIPTAAYADFDNYYEARKYVTLNKRPLVVKADGLAAGKGVRICDTNADAQVALTEMMLEGVFGAAGSRVVIEERLIGREVSILAFSDGKTVVTMPPARDHKRIYDNDEGPNTGGMGAFAPVPDVDEALVEEVRQRVLQPTIEGMAARGTPYVGVLYAGLMLTPDGIRNLEFNCRMGDPETQAILPLLISDLVEIMLACIDGNLSATPVRWKYGACATVVAASPGYPDHHPKGLPISGVENVREGTVFYASATRTNGKLVTSGGRVLAVSATGATLDDALKSAYAGISHLHFEGMHYRRDIGRIPTKL